MVQVEDDLEDEPPKKIPSSALAVPNELWQYISKSAVSKIASKSPNIPITGDEVDSSDAIIYIGRHLASAADELEARRRFFDMAREWIGYGHPNDRLRRLGRLAHHFEADPRKLRTWLKKKGVF